MSLFFGAFGTFLFWIIIIFLFVSVRQINQYERGVKFTLGKFSGVVDPGLTLLLPVIQHMMKVDVRIKAVEVPYQDAITKDNVSCKINAVTYYRVSDAGRSVVAVDNVWNASSQLAQTTMRNVVGELTLDELLTERDQASARIKELMATHIQEWGIEVMSVELKDISLPEDMQRTIGKQAEAERERRAVIITSEGEIIAAQNLAKAAQLLSTNPAAMHLRTLNSVVDVASDQSNTVVFVLPLEIMRAFQKMGEKSDT